MGVKRACFTVAALICPATRTGRCRAFRVDCAVGFKGNRRMTLPIMDLDSWTLSQSIVVFSVCALVIAIAGTRITRVVDQLADRTGPGWVRQPLEPCFWGQRRPSVLRCSR